MSAPVGVGHTDITERAAVAVAFVSDAQAAAYLPTVDSLRRAHPDVAFVVGGPEVSPLENLVQAGAAARRAPSMSSLLNEVATEGGGHVLAVLEPTVLPSDALTPALNLLDSELSIATVSFLANAAGFLSFPHRNTPVAHQMEGHDEESVTRRLRAALPPPEPASVPCAAGPAVLLSAHALSLVGPLAEVGDLRPITAVVDFSMRARRHGLLDVVEPSTYCARLFDADPRGQLENWLTSTERDWVLERHPFFESLLEHELESGDAALAMVHTVARSSLAGLRILIDGSCLGPREMGTQVHAVALIEALSRQAGVGLVSVALASGIPAYAERVLRQPRVDARVAPGGDLSAFGPVDIVHRPFHPDGPIDVDSWRRTASRTVITVQDLIGFHVGAYHASPEKWSAYRESFVRAVGQVDGVVSNSLHVEWQMRLQRLPVEADRVFTVEPGTDHLRGDEAERVPVELVARGFTAADFLLVTGTNYAHKNRHAAIGALTELRRRGLALSLVIVGAAVPFGSSRVLETVSRSSAADGSLFVLPEVASEERNWLLRHARVLLYPTSAEGFGLVPYEAAAYGTPTVLVPVGPLAPVAAAMPVAASDWNPGSLADAAQKLICDPGLARSQVEAVLSTASSHTWDGGATKLVAVYRSLLARPRRRPEP